MTVTDLNWTELGAALRASAMDAHEGELPDVSAAYTFLLDNPSCFVEHPDGDGEWPAEMPAEPPDELVEAYGLDPAEEAVRGIAAEAGICSLDARGLEYGIVRADDFHQLHVNMLRRMLLEAYRRGKAACAGSVGLHLTPDEVRELSMARWLPWRLSRGQSDDLDAPGWHNRSMAPRE